MHDYITLLSLWEYILFFVWKYLNNIEELGLPALETNLNHFYHFWQALNWLQVFNRRGFLASSVKNSERKSLIDREGKKVKKRERGVRLCVIEKYWKRTTNILPYQGRTQGREPGGAYGYVDTEEERRWKRKRERKWSRVAVVIFWLGVLKSREYISRGSPPVLSIIFMQRQAAIPRSY